MGIADYIPFGRENAVTRETLVSLTGQADRKVRNMIEDARCGDEIIICWQDGTGYYRTDDLDEMAHYYRQERARALSILKRLKGIRKRLKEAGRL